MARIAVLLPCYNEAITIAKVVDDFRRVLPDADIYVYDNNSTDGSGQIAREHGAIVRREKRQGKGNVVRQMFRDIDADVYVMADADDTYPAEAAPELIEPVLAGDADMVIGDRLGNGSYARENDRPMHEVGNALVCKIVNSLYHADLRDIMTGYRAFGRTFVKTYPVQCEGFEIETELSIHALDKHFRIEQISIDYRDRPEGSHSKLSTVGDGALVLKAIASLCREYRPMLFFNILALISLIVCLCCGIPVIVEYVETSWVSHLPLAVAAAGFGVLTVLFFICGLILDALARQMRQQFELQVLSVSTLEESSSETREQVR